MKNGCRQLSWKDALYTGKSDHADSPFRIKQHKKRRFTYENVNTIDSITISRFLQFIHLFLKKSIWEFLKI